MVIPCFFVCWNPVKTQLGPTSENSSTDAKLVKQHDDHTRSLNSHPPWYIVYIYITSQLHDLVIMSGPKNESL